MVKMDFLRWSRWFLCLVMIIPLSCGQFLNEEVTLDPNKAQTPELSILLPSIEVNIASTYGGFHSRINGLHVQHVEAVFRAISYSSIIGEPARFDEPWIDFYTNIFVELRTIRTVATENAHHHYLAIANILTSFASMMATDVWGDIPFTEAGLGIGNLHPKFDQQELIYTEIHRMLDDAIELLNGPIGAIDPGASDIIYGGDPARWIMAANALKARAYLHFDDYERALSHAQQSFGSRDENLRITYPGGNYVGPWYLQNETRTGDYEFSTSLRFFMLDLNDLDRLAVLDQPFTTNHPYFIAEYGVDLISYREIQFIIAEAGLEEGIPAMDIHEAYLNGITASFQELGFESSSQAYQDYIAQVTIDPGVGNVEMEHVLNQKYIGLFAQPEAYSDWRRRDVPSLTPFSGPAIPVRWPYSNASLEFNMNAPADDIDIYFERVSWDQD